MPKWTHSDPRGLQNQFNAAIERSLAHGWRNGPIDERGAELRAFAMGTVLTAGRCLVYREFDQTEIVLGDFPPVEDWPDVQHMRAAETVLNTLTLLSDNRPPVNKNLVTIGGLAPQGLPVEGWPILLAKIAASAVWAFAACYIAERYEDTIDRFLARGAAGENLMAAQAAAVKVLENHANEEVKVGAVLPYAPQENAVIDTLLATQTEFADKQDPPKDDLPAIGGPSFQIGTMLALGVVAFFLLKGKM